MAVDCCGRLEIREFVRGETPLKKRCECLQSDDELVPSFPALVARLWSSDGDSQLEATTQFRKLLSTVGTPPNVEIPSGVVRHFVYFLTQDNHQRLQFEAAWALTNIAFESSENTIMVIEQGALPNLIRLLHSPSDTVREQAVWVLGNLAGDSPNSRDLVLAAGALLPLLALLNGNEKHSMLGVATWTLLNFCRGKPRPPFHQIRPALPALLRLVHSTDVAILTDACLALSHLSDGSCERIQAVIEAGFCPRLVHLLGHFSPWVLIPALRTVGNIAAAGAVQTQCIIEHSVLPSLLSLLMIQDHMTDVKKEACRTVSNIAAGNKENLQEIFKVGLFVPLLNLCQNAEFDVKKEAVCAISNATSGGSEAQIRYLVRQNCIKPLCDLLDCPESRIVTACLEGLANILEVGEAEKNLKRNVNCYAQLIDEAKGLGKIKNLQNYDNNKIREKAVEIVETYWLPYSDGTRSRFCFSKAGGHILQSTLQSKLKSLMVDDLVMINE